jgi:DNA polymerase III delta prime subunit
MSPWLDSAWRLVVEGLQSKAPPHAWCIVHPPGVVASELTDRLVRLLLCQNPSNDEPCGQCASCRIEETHPDLVVLEPEGAAGMIKVDSVRESIDTAYMTASMGGRRVVLVRPADCLNQASSNALLKVVEEPPSGTVFVFQTALPGKLLPTLVSRLRMVKVPMPTPEILEKTAQSMGVSHDDMLLAETLLAEPMAEKTDPERLALARDVLKAMTRIRHGEDSQVVVKTFAKADALVASVVMERVCEQLIRAQFDDVSNPVTSALVGPYPPVTLLYQFKERIVEVRKQAQAGIAVNAGLALGSLFAAWGFIWTRVQG